MRRKMVVIILMSLMIYMSLWLAPVLITAHASTVPLATPTASQTSTTSSTSTGNAPPTNSLDSTIIAALIGLTGIVVGAIITGVFVLYQTRRTDTIPNYV